MRAFLLFLTAAASASAVDPADLPARVTALEQKYGSLDAKLDAILAAVAGARGNVTVTNNAQAAPAGRLEAEGWIAQTDGTYDRPIRVRTRPAAPEVSAVATPFAEAPPPLTLRLEQPPPTFRLEAPRPATPTIAPVAAAPSFVLPGSTATARIPINASVAAPFGVIDAGGCVNGNCGSYRAVSRVSGPGYRARSVVRQR